MKAWQGRFSENTDVLMEAFNESISFDQKLIHEDIEGSIVHVSMLKRIGVITTKEQNLMIDHLLEIQNDYTMGLIEFSIVDEDIHMALENELVKRIGVVGKKMHTGRSRNDQVATDMRLYAKTASLTLIEGLKKVMVALLDLAEMHLDVTMPGYTHLQKAQPILLSFYLNAYAHMFKRDIERLQDSLKRIKVLPLGSGALAGVNYASDRKYMVEKLGFDSASKNALDAISDRDFVIELQSIMAITVMHFSRISEDFIIWNSEAYGFITLSDGFSTGSSIMPQKKNPDACELARGKTGRIFGNLMSILTVMKGLPMAYNKDMQEDKEGFFDSVNTICDISNVYEAMLKEITFNTQAMKDSVESGYLNATELADYLVKKGMAFRDSHHITGSVVKYASGLGVPIECLGLEVLKEFSPIIDGDVYKALVSAVNSKLSQGSTNIIEVKKDIVWLRTWLGGV